MSWLPIESAPTDRPIVGWCKHYEAQPDERGRLDTYHGHAEGLGHVEDGPHVIEWGGAYDDSTWEFPNQASCPDWWFRFGSEFEEVANPTHWMPLPEAPS